jgi:transposase-like protein
MPQAARSTPAQVEPARAGGEFFAWPSNPNHRRYEALRAYLFEGSSAADAARRAGWSVATLRSAVRDFRAGKTGFFATPRPGPTTAPAKDAARRTIIGLRQQGLSATEISEALAGTPTPLNRTGVAEVLREEGFARMWPRPLAARGGGRRTELPRARLLDFADLPPRCETNDVVRDRWG